MEIPMSCFEAAEDEEDAQCEEEMKASRRRYIFISAEPSQIGKIVSALPQPRKIRRVSETLCCHYERGENDEE